MHPVLFQAHFLFSDRMKQKSRGRKINCRCSRIDDLIVFSLLIHGAFGFMDLCAKRGSFLVKHGRIWKQAVNSLFLSFPIHPSLVSVLPSPYLEHERFWKH